MSWWDAGGISNLASQALKNAQKQIDKVLDIQEGSQSTSSSFDMKMKKKGELQKEESLELGDGNDFWSAWLPFPEKKQESASSIKSSVSESTSKNAWSFQFGTTATAEDGRDKGSIVTAPLTGDSEHMKDDPCSPKDKASQKSLMLKLSAKQSNQQSKKTVSVSRKQEEDPFVTSRKTEGDVLSKDFGSPEDLVLSKMDRQDLSQEPVQEMDRRLLESDPGECSTAEDNFALCSDVKIQQVPKKDAIFSVFKHNEKAVEKDDSLKFKDISCNVLSDSTTAKDVQQIVLVDSASITNIEQNVLSGPSGIKDNELNPSSDSFVASTNDEQTEINNTKVNPLCDSSARNTEEYLPCQSLEDTSSTHVDVAEKKDLVSESEWEKSCKNDDKRATDDDKDVQQVVLVDSASITNIEQNVLSGPSGIKDNELNPSSDSFVASTNDEQTEINNTKVNPLCDSSARNTEEYLPCQSLEDTSSTHVDVAEKKDLVSDSEWENSCKNDDKRATDDVHQRNVGEDVSSLHLLSSVDGSNIRDKFITVETASAVKVEAESLEDCKDVEKVANVINIPMDRKETQSRAFDLEVPVGTMKSLVTDTELQQIPVTCAVINCDQHRMRLDSQSGMDTFGSDDLVRFAHAESEKCLKGLDDDTTENRESEPVVSSSKALEISEKPGTSQVEGNMSEKSRGDHVIASEMTSLVSEPVKIRSDQQTEDASLLETIEEEEVQLSPAKADSSDVLEISKLDSSVDTCGSSETVIEKSLSDETDNCLDMHSNNGEQSTDGMMSSSSSSSYVKCMIEEAMEEHCKPEDSDSHSNSADRSESSKTESEHNSEKSISGHDSGDEIDTTTSSDIEIISTPTPNGERGERLFDLSPLRMTLQKALIKHSPMHAHQRSDSQSSSSTYSKCGESEQLSPGRHSLERQDVEFGDEAKETSNKEPTEHATSEHKSDQLSGSSEKDSLSPENLLKLEPQTRQTRKLCKKLAEMAEILHARENKLVLLSRENHDLMESSSILRNQLHQAENARDAEMIDLKELADEFTIRIGEAERKLQTVLKEKEILKKQLQSVEEDASRSHAAGSFHEKMLREKGKQVEELLNEGEKLSKQQLQSSNTIKKLRAKEKENESLISSQKKKLEDEKIELQRLKNVLDSKEVLEMKQTEAINKLNAAFQKQEKDVLRLKSELEDAMEKARGLQVALDNSYKEIAELHKSNAARSSKVQEAALSAEMQVREELRFSMEKDQLKFRHEKESLIMQIEDLRISMSRMEKEYGRREDLLKQEMVDLQQRLQEDEARNQELTQGVTSATRPLLRQIENLQSTFAAQSASWERAERNLSERLADLQNQLAVAVEKERMASDKVIEINAKLISLETQNAQLRQDKSQLAAHLEVEKSKIQMLEDVHTNFSIQVETVKQQCSQEISDLKKEKIYLETHLEMEKTKVETEKKKLAQALDMIKEVENHSRASISPISSNRGSPVILSGESTTLGNLSQEDILEKSLLLSTSNGNKMNLYESFRHGGVSSLLENLQSQLKQKEGEILQLQEDIAQFERTRESMARELVNLSNLNDDLQEKVNELPELKEKHTDLYQRYNALLQMYGEKVEEAEELHLDLSDIKKMYKDQIDHLLAN